MPLVKVKIRVLESALIIEKTTLVPKSYLRLVQFSSENEAATVLLVIEQLDTLKQSKHPGL